MQRFFIGMDEAGYGPNLGPLVLGASRFRLGPASDHLDFHEMDLYALFEGQIVSQLPKKKTLGSANAVPLLIADSKVVYKPGAGLTGLERGVLGALNTFLEFPKFFGQLVDILDADPQNAIPTLPWFKEYDRAIPSESNAEEIASAVHAYRAVVDVAVIESLHAKAIFPQQFNELCETCGNKAIALTESSLGLLSEILQQIRNEYQEVDRNLAAFVVCDKHGGRNNYAPALQHQFPEAWIEVRRESREVSGYYFETDGIQVEVEFRKGGESHLPTALASMTAKYVRELAMEAFNAFWMREIPGLRPTAGYPVDAIRCREAITQRQRTLKIDDRVLWRFR